MFLKLSVKGEKMVISFLYFIELCKGETTVDSSATGKIVVIDDQFQVCLIFMYLT